MEFNKYLKNEFSQENLTFILECKELEQKVTLEEFSMLAKQIYKDYIMVGSPSEINIVSSIRNNLIAVFEPIIANEKTLEVENYDIYGPAVAHILLLLEKDPYKRFCKVLRSSLRSDIAQKEKSNASNFSINSSKTHVQSDNARQKQVKELKSDSKTNTKSINKLRQ